MDNKRTSLPGPRTSDPVKPDDKSGTQPPKTGQSPLSQTGPPSLSQPIPLPPSQTGPQPPPKTGPLLPPQTGPLPPPQTGPLPPPQIGPIPPPQTGTPIAIIAPPYKAPGQPKSEGQIPPSSVSPPPYIGPGPPPPYYNTQGPHGHRNVIIISGIQWTPYPAQIICPNCRENVVTRTTPVPGILTWLLSGACIFVGCWLGCCLIPCFIPECQDVIHSCPVCKAHLGTYSRL